MLFLIVSRLNNVIKLSSFTLKIACRRLVDFYGKEPVRLIFFAEQNYHIWSKFSPKETIQIIASMKMFGLMLFKRMWHHQTLFIL